MSWEKQLEEMERGFLGEKSYDFGLSCKSSCSKVNSNDSMMHLKFDMHHLGLTKQAQYVGMRNLKHMNSTISFTDRLQSRKISVNIAPYAKTDFAVSVKQSIQIKENTKGNIVLAVLNDTPSEIRDDRKIRFSIAGEIKSEFVNAKLAVDCEDTAADYGLNAAFNIGNFRRIRQIRKFDGNIENNNYKSQEYIKDQNEGNKEKNDSQQQQQQIGQEYQQQEGQTQSQQIINLTSQQNQLQQKQLSTRDQFLWFLPSQVEISGEATKRSNTEFTWKLSGLAVTGKLQGIVQIELENAALKRVLYMLRYNSSFWLRVSDSSDGNTKGISSVYEYAFNESIKLRNYINSSYTVATQLAYQPTQFLTLLYSANVNIQKFLNDVEDYKVGYGIYIHA